MRVLDPEVVDVIWAGIEPLIPVREVHHPPGCHRQRASDRDCSSGSSPDAPGRTRSASVEVWSPTRPRERRDEWMKLGVFNAMANEAICGYDKVIGLDLSDVAVDGSLHKSPCGGEGTGKNPTDRAKLAWKWSILTDRVGIPIGWVADGRTATTRSSSRPPWTTPRSAVFSPRSRRSGSTAVMTRTSRVSPRRTRHR